MYLILALLSALSFSLLAQGLPTTFDDSTSALEKRLIDAPDWPQIKNGLCPPLGIGQCWAATMAATGTSTTVVVLSSYCTQLAQATGQLPGVEAWITTANLAYPPIITIVNALDPNNPFTLKYNGVDVTNRANLKCWAPVGVPATFTGTQYCLMPFACSLAGT